MDGVRAGGGAMDQIAFGNRVRWRRRQWVAAFLLAFASVLVTRVAWIDIARLGIKDDECQYILIAPFVVLILIWVRRARLLYCQMWGRWIGFVLAVVGAMLWIVGYRFSAPTFWHGGPVLLAAGAFLSVVGADVLIKFLPAFVALLFLIPITPTRRHLIASPMETYAARWTCSCCQLLGLNVQQHGNLMTVNGTEVEVAEACSGIRQLVSFWLAGYVLAFTQPLRWFARALLLLAIPFVAVGSNIMRLVPTVWMYSYGAGPAADRFHDLAGWVMLFAAFAAIQLTLWVLRWAMVPIQHFQAASV